MNASPEAVMTILPSLSGFSALIFFMAADPCLRAKKTLPVIINVRQESRRSPGRRRNVRKGVDTEHVRYIFRCQVSKRAGADDGSLNRMRFGLPTIY
jgi:hypothetical protein